MTFKLKTQPELVHWSETRQFKLLDETGAELYIRVIEGANGPSYWIWVEEKGSWNDVTDKALLKWLEGGNHDFGAELATED